MVTQRSTETTVIDGVEYKTRHWYMDCAKDLTGTERHRIYYGQFCVPRIMLHVAGMFTKVEWARIAKAYSDGDVHLNGCTELSQWDRNDARQLIGRLVTECTYEDAPKGIMYWSPSQNTCILKEAARQLIESGSYPQ